MERHKVTRYKDPLCESNLPSEIFEGLDKVSKTRGCENSVKARKGGQRNHPTTCDQEYTDAELEFMFAYHEYKKKTGHKFPTLKETFGIFVSLGYIQPKRQIA